MIVRDYPATEAAALHALEADALRLGLGQRTALTLVLMLEELYTNTLKYGHAGHADAGRSHAGRGDVSIQVSLHALAGDEVELRYEDDATPHDPFSPASNAQANAAAQGDPDDRPIGRLGILLLRRLSRHAAYEYRHGRNVIRLRLGADASPADFQSP